MTKDKVETKDIHNKDVSRTRDANKEIVRKAFKDADTDVIFDNVDATPKELTDALVSLDISFVMGDMPHKTKDGGITYKKTLTVDDKEEIQKIIDKKD